MKHKYVHEEAVHNLEAPQALVPTVIELLNPRSVVDVGCGTGTFLKVFKDCGISAVLGIDGPWGNEHLRKKHLDPSEFKECDLEQVVHFDQRFDLAVCLEVAEHLSPSAAENIVETLTNASDTVWFSAAVPFQGGQNHINEQPLSYWVKLFEARGYVLSDVLRPIWWNQGASFVWYRQNSVLFFRGSPRFVNQPTSPPIVDVIHPELFRLYASLPQGVFFGYGPTVYKVKMSIKKLLGPAIYNLIPFPKRNSNV